MKGRNSLEGRSLDGIFGLFGELTINSFIVRANRGRSLIFSSGTSILITGPILVREEVSVECQIAVHPFSIFDAKWPSVTKLLSMSTSLPSDTAKKLETQVKISGESKRRPPRPPV